MGGMAPGKYRIDARNRLRFVELLVDPAFSWV